MTKKEHLKLMSMISEIRILKYDFSDFSDEFRFPKQYLSFIAESTRV